MLSCQWTGNLREMKKIIRRATLLVQGCYITLAELGSELLEASTVPNLNMSLRNEETEKEHILEALKRSTELGEASHRSNTSGRTGERMHRSIPRGMRIQKKKASDSLLNRRLLKKTAATYSPTVTQYHRRDEA